MKIDILIFNSNIMTDDMNPVVPQSDDTQTAPMTPPADEPTTMPEATPEEPAVPAEPTPEMPPEE
jgi:hypothetical protein